MPPIPDHRGKLVARRYQLQAPIGEGGFGRVYIAIDQRLSAQVAVKIIHPWFAVDEEWVERFAAEAKTAAAIGHPGVVRITDTGVDRKLGPFTVAELVDGGSLRDLLDQDGPMSARRAADLVAQAADALAAAHARGVVHRDVKPGNLLLDNQGRVRVCDFGIARVQTGATKSSAAHTVIGTPAYMSPEQSRGKATGPATDQYALGVVLHELLAGQPPFDGETPVAIAMAHISDPPPKPPPGTPTAIRAALARALAKDPDDRYPGIDAFAAALRDEHTAATALLDADHAPTGKVSHVRRARSAPSRPTEPTAIARAPSRRRRQIAGALILALVLAGAGVVLLIGGVDDEPRVTGGTAGTSADANRGGLTAGDAEAGREPKRVSVPTIIGLSENGARARLGRRGLDLTAVRRQSIRQPAGRIVSQRPSAGASVAGDLVGATVSDGPPPAHIPDLADVSSRSAQIAIAQAGLTVGATHAVPSGRPAGTVIRTDPAGGTSVPRGTAVTLVVARAKAWRTVGTFELTADGSTPSFAIRGTSWRLTYTMGPCEYVCPRLDIDGDEYEQISLSEGTHTSFGPPGRGTYRLTSDSIGSDSYELSVTVEQYS